MKRKRVLLILWCFYNSVSRDRVDRSLTFRDFSSDATNGKLSSTPFTKSSLPAVLLSRIENLSVFCLHSHIWLPFPLRLMEYHIEINKCILKLYRSRMANITQSRVTRCAHNYGKICFQMCIFDFVYMGNIYHLLYLACTYTHDVVNSEGRIAVGYTSLPCKIECLPAT